MVLKKVEDIKGVNRSVNRRTRQYNDPKTDIQTLHRKQKIEKHEPH